MFQHFVLPFPSLRLECPRNDELALGLELVEIVDSAGELALDSCARLSRNVAVSPSVKLQFKNHPLNALNVPTDILAF